MDDPGSIIDHLSMHYDILSTCPAFVVKLSCHTQFTTTSTAQTTQLLLFVTFDNCLEIPMLIFSISPVDIERQSLEAINEEDAETNHQGTAPFLYWHLFVLLKNCIFPDK